jgi:hypothetical protein
MISFSFVPHPAIEERGRRVSQSAAGEGFSQRNASKDDARDGG